jgi:hypothetical protein
MCVNTRRMTCTDLFLMIRGVEEISWDRDLTCKVAFSKEVLHNHYPTPPQGEYMFGFLYLAIFCKNMREGCNFRTYF